MGVNNNFNVFCNLIIYPKYVCFVYLIVHFSLGRIRVAILEEKEREVDKNTLVLT